MKAKPHKRHKSGFRGPSPDVGKATQFKKGQPSANPGGRPKTKPFLDAILEHLARNPKEARAVIENAFKKAKSGSIAHMRELIDLTDGPVQQAIEVGGSSDGGPILLKVKIVKPRAN
jgi:hypothetical protein